MAKRVLLWPVSLALLVLATNMVSAVETDAISGNGLTPGTRMWGQAYYLMVGNDNPAGAGKDWNGSQETGVTLNLRSASGLDFLTDIIFPVDHGGEQKSVIAIQQLAIKVSPLETLTLIAGKQRLNWGTGKILTAIDTLEPRANPYDVRSILNGVAGMKAVFIPNGWFSASAVALPAVQLSKSKAAVRADFTLEDWNLDLGLAAVRYEYTDTAGSEEAGHLAVLSDCAWSAESWVFYEEAQWRQGRDAGYYFPTMTRPNGWDGSDASVFRGVAGAMLQADLGLSRPMFLVAEYLYNGDGLNADEAKTYAADASGWQRAGQPGGARIPDAFYGLGGFRRHFGALALQNIALDRYLLLGLSGIAGLESGFTRWAASLEWDPSQSTAVTLRYEYFQDGVADQISERFIIPIRNRLTLTFAASF